MNMQIQKQLYFIAAFIRNELSSKKDNDKKNVILYDDDSKFYISTTCTLFFDLKKNQARSHKIIYNSCISQLLITVVLYKCVRLNKYEESQM